MRQRQPLEDQDPNCQDSGYSNISEKEDSKSVFCFAEPNALPAKKLLVDQSPRKENSPPKASWAKPGTNLVHSLSSGSESLDDGFAELFELEKVVSSEHHFMLLAF